MIIFLWVLTIVLLIVSLVKSKQKTKTALLVAFSKTMSVLSVFILVMACLALVLTYIPDSVIQKYIGAGSGLSGVFLALGMGSIAVMPGFAAFPLCAALKMQGIPYYIIAAFSLSVMNVGIMTFPIEKKFLGTKVALLRNFIAFLICIIATFLIKLIFLE